MKYLSYLLLTMIFVFGCTKEVGNDNYMVKAQEKVGNMSHVLRSDPVANPFVNDTNFQEIIRLILFDNELGFSLESGEITLETFHEILSFIAIPQNSWMPDFSALENFNHPSFMQFLLLNFSDTGLSAYFNQLFILISNFYLSNYQMLSGLSESELNSLFSEAVRHCANLDVLFRVSDLRSGEDDHCPCDWCHHEYNTCFQNAYVNSVGIVAAGAATAISLALYSGGTLTAGGAAAILGSIFGGGFSMVTGYYACNTVLNDCLLKHNCLQSGGTGENQSGNMSWWHLIPHKL